MDKKQIAQEIKETEEKLAELRKKLEEPEARYKMGTRWGRCGEKYILAAVGPGKAALIGLQTGNRWNDPVECGEIQYKGATEREWRLIRNGKDFRPA